MGIFDGGRAKKEAEEAAKKAKSAEYQAVVEKNKANIAKEKAEKELKELKDAKSRQDLSKVMQARARASAIGRAASSLGTAGIHGIRTGPLAAQAPKIIASYTVKKGDTLGQIAKNFYGDTGPKYWNLIQAANKDLIKDINKIEIGQVFKIPELPVELKRK